MSRTDKDLPYWVAAEWWEPWHVRCRHDSILPTAGRCRLPPVPVRRRPVPITWRARKVRCEWLPCDDVLPDGRPRRWYSQPPRLFIRHVWSGPQRRTVRDLGRRAAAEYRATGQVDTELPVRQARHGAHWVWS